MGYTHYWKHKEVSSDHDWTEFTHLVKIILNLAADEGIALAAEYDLPNEPPAVTAEHVRFNGVGDDGHETFLITRDPTSFEFCKTARKPYDDVVVACLMAAERSLPGFSWTSDGDNEPEFDARGRALLTEAIMFDMGAEV